MKGSGSNEQVTRDDAKIYINEIKDVFKDEKHKYNEFLKIMKEFKKTRTDIICMRARVKKLFEGHRQLLSKFNIYMSDEFEITPEKAKAEGSDSKKQVTSNDAKIYVNEIKDAFKDEKHKYNEFLQTMKDIRKKRTDIMCMLARVKELFEGHKELLLKFNTYLPAELEITPPLEMSEITTSQEKPKITPPLEKAEMDIEYARKYLSMVKTRFHDNPDVYQSFLAILKMYRHKEKSIEEISQMINSLFKDHSDLVDGFNEFLP